MVRRAVARGVTRVLRRGPRGCGSSVPRETLGQAQWAAILLDLGTPTAQIGLFVGAPALTCVRGVYGALTKKKRARYWLQPFGVPAA